MRIEHANPLPAQLPVAPAHPGSSEFGFRRWLPCVAAGVFWLGLFNHLRLEWSVNAQYSYGFVVPFLALYLWWRRWESRPAPRPAPAPGLVLGLSAILAVVWLPLRLVEKANPDWRFVSWSMAVVPVGIALLWLLHGGGLAWVRHFLFPVCFTLLAVPWPGGIEGRIVNGLMQLDATAAVEISNWCGIPAIQRGNVIQIAERLVGVDEACSGIRSLQTALMIGLFLGELYRLNAMRRLLLVGSAVAFTYLCNVGRTFLLVWLTASHGLTAMEEWHDAAGLGVLAVSLAGLWAITLLVKPRAAEHETDPSAGHHRQPARALPAAFAVAVGVVFLIAEAAAEGWYRLHETRPPNALWTVQPPAGRQGLRDVPIPDATRAMLKYNEGRNVSWSGADGTAWSLFFFRWEPGRTASILARSHRPEICLPLAGLKLVDDSRVRVFETHGIRIPFRAYLFDHSGRPLHVFYCVWEQAGDNQPGADQPNSLDISHRFDAVRQGRRNRGQQVLEVAVWGARSGSDAESQFQQLLDKIIGPEP